jgi:hypothetical protein
VINQSLFNKIFYTQNSRNGRLPKQKMDGVPFPGPVHPEFPAGAIAVVIIEI